MNQFNNTNPVISLSEDYKNNKPYEDYKQKNKELLRKRVLQIGLITLYFLLFAISYLLL